MFEEIISAGIVSIVVIILLITLPGEAPLKRLLSKRAISKLFYYYTTFYLIFAVILIFWTICNWGWKSLSFQSYTIIRKLEKRISKLLLLIILCIPSRYILRLMTIPSKRTKNNNYMNKLETITEKTEEYLNKPHKRHKSVPLINSLSSPQKVRDSIDMKDIKNLFFGKSNKNTRKPPVLRINKTTPFQELEILSTLHNVSKWEPLPLELFEIARLFQLFAKIRVHGQHNIPQNKPCLIVINHALGHGFDVPMMVYILRKYCNLSHVRVLVSSEHFNYPIWCDIIYYLGGVPRTHQITEHLMKNGENIIMFAAKKKKTSMIWDNQRHLYLDLVHKYDYILVPAVCVSDDDVINMVYNIDDPSKLENKKKMERQESNQYDTDNTDNDTDNEEEKNNTFRSFKTVSSRIRHGYRKQYHLRFSEPISVPKNIKNTKNTKNTKRARKSRRSTEYKMDEDDVDFDDNDSSLTRSSGSKVEVRFSGLNIKHKTVSFEYDRSVSSESISDIDNKYNDNESIDSFNIKQRKRRWSHELEVGLKNAVEDAMTDGISEMYNKLKTDPNSSLLKTMQKKMKSISLSPSLNRLQNDIRSNKSNDVPAKGLWAE